MDFAGPFQGKMILVFIDSHSKWIEAFPTNSCTSHTVIEHSRTLFAQFGVPEVLVSDNGACFVSQEFETFLLKNGIKHVTTAPFHPSSNGLAERAVQIIKKGLKKESNGSMTSRLAKILMAYRTTPQSTTGETPSQLLQGRRIRKRLDLLKPSVGERVEGRQWQQKLNHDSLVQAKTFTKDDPVYIRNFGTGQRWLPGVIQQSIGPVSFLVKLSNGQLVRRHQDHLRRRQAEETEPHPEVTTKSTSDESELEMEIDVMPNRVISQEANGEGSSHGTSSEQVNTPPDVPEARSVEQPVSQPSTETLTDSSVSQSSGTTPAVKTYPKRNRKAPDWYRTVW